MTGQPVDGQGLLPIPEVWLSISDLATLKKVSKAAISKRVIKLEGEGLITARKDGAEKKVNLVEFDRAIGANTDPAQQLRNPGGIAMPTTAADTTSPAEPEKPGKPSYSANKELLSGYQAENERLDLEERLGRLCDKSDIEARTFSVFRRLRDRALSYPATVAPRIAHLTDERSIRMILEEEMRRLLDTLANDLDNPDAVDEEAGEPADVAAVQ